MIKCQSIEIYKDEATIYNNVISSVPKYLHMCDDREGAIVYIPIEIPYYEGILSIRLMHYNKSGDAQYTSLNNVKILKDEDKMKLKDKLDNKLIDGTILKCIIDSDGVLLNSILIDKNTIEYIDYICNNKAIGINQMMKIYYELSEYMMCCNQKDVVLDIASTFELIQDTDIVIDKIKNKINEDE